MGVLLFDWIEELDQRRDKNISAIAVANQNARIAWTVLTKKEAYKAVAWMKAFNYKTFVASQ